MFFLKRSCTTIFITARPSSKSVAFHLQDRLRPVNPIRLPQNQSSLRTLLFNSIFNHVFRYHNLAVPYYSMLVIFMIYLF